MQGRNKSVAIIGSGLGGLALASRLAYSGFQVDLYERNSTYGGKIREFAHRGYRFDGGPSVITMMDAHIRHFQDLGKSLSDYIKYEKLDVVMKYFYEDGTVINAYADLEKYADEISAKTMDSSDHFLKYMYSLDAILGNIGPTFFEKPIHEISTYMDIDVLKAILKLPVPHLLRSMDKTNRKIFKDEKTIKLFNRYATYLGGNPYKQPGVFNVIGCEEQIHGTYWIKGGNQRLAEAYYDLAVEKGVRLHFNANVSSINYEKKQAKSITVNNEIVPSEIVISNADIISTKKHLLKKKLVEPKHNDLSLSGLVFYWGMNRTFDELAFHNTFFSDDYQKEFTQIDQGIIPNDPTIYINITSKKDPSDAPIGCENWFVMLNIPAKELNPQEVEDAKSKVVDKLSKKLKIDIRKHIAYEEIMRPQDLEKISSSYNGSIYGYTPNKVTSLLTSQPNRDRSIKGLYYVGGTVHPGGGMPMVVNSAKITSDLINKHENH